MEGKPLFGIGDKNQWTFECEAHTLGRTLAFLGPLPQALLDRCQRLHDFFDTYGKLKCQEVAAKDCTFDAHFVRLEGNDKASFIAFIRRMLVWLPEQRATAKELLSDPWLQSD